VISISKLNKSFGSQHVLRDLDLEIETGLTTVILGGSGQGKSVLLKHLIGLLQPDSGQIILDNEDIAALKDSEMTRVRKRFGMLFQDAALFDSMNVFDNVAFPLVEHFKLSDEEIGRRVTEVLEHVNLAGIEHKWPSELSGGMRKRVGLARALVHEPEIILYDEPTTGLDPLTSEQINWLVNNTRDQLAITSVVISHDLHSTQVIADRVAMLHEGQIVEYGAPDAFFKSTNPIVRRFLGKDQTVGLELG
jgi:phospholipid/cholesterol/gamma-HCH transport system ATP-binding protein